MKAKSILIVLSLILYQSVSAKVKLPAVLGDNMVLQQQTSVNLWGNASPSKLVRIITSWNQKKYVAQADASGKWKIQVTTPSAGGPFEITFDDGEKTTLKNILIGEVWFCSGQSNMEMPVKGFHRQPVEGAQDVLVKARKETPIRMFTVKKNPSSVPLDTCAGVWNEHTPEGVAETSAAAYFFARYLNDVLDIPVGLVISDWGGTRVQAWMSEEAVAPFRDEVTDSNTSSLYNGMIAPVTPYTIKGMIWYQGESNSYNPTLYKKLMPAFVAGLRKDFGVGDFPFYYVQIAPHTYGGIEKKGAPGIREAQLEMMKTVPNCGMAVTMDIGAKTQIHPAKKEEVGKRLAYWALAKTYQKNSFGYSGPIYNSMSIEGSKVYIYFDNVPEGVAPLEVELGGFEMAGSDRKFYPARAIVEGRRGLLAVTCEQVPAPVAVRYGYKDYVEGSLFDVYGLPASPFRTDNWDDVEKMDSVSRNPFITHMFTADASAHVWDDGRLYVYASHDVNPPRGCDLMDRYHVFSTDDMINWKDHGEILNSSQVPWGRKEGGFMWAPDCAYKNGTYYYYFPHPSGTDWNHTWKIGVATSKYPDREFKVQGYIEGLGDTFAMIDPCVYVDEDGQAYFYFGGGGRCMGAKLKENMMELAEPLRLMEGLADFHEATWIHKYKGTYYLSYSDNHQPGGNRMNYATADSPLGPWKYRGVYMEGTGIETNHGSIVEYKGQWYAFYHNGALSGGKGNLRSICVDKLYYNEDGTIRMVRQTSN